MNTYTVIDRQNNEIIGKGLPYKELGELLDIDGLTASRYAVTKTLLQDRYEIKVDGTLDNNPLKFTPRQLEEWDKVREAAKLLKTGRGKIVARTVNGEVIKCVERI